MLRNMKRTDVNRDYLLYTLGSRFGLEQLLMRSSGGSYPAITEDELDRILIPIPDERKQRELVAAMDAARSARRVKLAKADALLADMDDFVIATLEISPPPVDGPKVFALPSSVCRSTGRCDVSFHLPYYRHVAAALKKSDVPKLPLGELSPEIVGGATPTKGSLEFYADSGIKFLRILNVKANEFDLSDLNFIKPEIHQGDLKRSQLDAGDVLMTITGRVGNAAVVTQDLLPANINQHIVRLRIVLPDVLPEYLAAYLNTSIGLAMSNRGVTGGTRIALDYGTIRALSIPMPSLIIQRRIAEDVARRREQARRLRQQADAEWQTAKTEFEAALLEGRK